MPKLMMLPFEKFYLLKFLCVSTASGQISRLALSALDALAAPSSPVAVMFLPESEPLLGNFTRHFPLPVTVWNCFGKDACYERFERYVTQGDAAFPRPGAVLAPFQGSRSSSRLALTAKRFGKYHSNIQWIFSVRKHDEALQAFGGCVCQVITVTDSDINVPADGYRRCATRNVLTTIEDGSLKETLPLPGKYTKNELVTYAVRDESNEFCFRFSGIVSLFRDAYDTLNNTLVEECNPGDTDSLLLDRRVDFLIILPESMNPHSYYGYATLPPNSLCFLTRRQGPMAPSFASTWLSFFIMFLILAPLAAVATLVLSVRIRRSERGVPNRSDLILFFFSTYVWQSPHPLAKCSSISVRVVSIAWMFGMLFLVQFNQSNITASRNAPAQLPQLRRVAELVSRFDDGELKPCMHIVVAGIIRKFGGDAQHLASIRHAMQKCGDSCLSVNVYNDCIPKSVNGTHALVDMSASFNQNNAMTRGAVVGDETLLTYVDWLPTHARYPRRYQHRRLLQMFEESGITAHGMKKEFPPCPHCDALVSFEIPFTSCLFIYLTGCGLSLFAFCIELSFKRYAKRPHDLPRFTKRQKP